MKICKQCNLTYDDYVNYCPTCGQLVEKVEEKKTCSKCGFQLEDYMAFCPECGTSVNFNEHEKSVSSDINHDVRKEKINSDNSAEGVVSADELVTKGQIIYTLICVAIALISFIGTGIRTHTPFIGKLLCAFVVGGVVLYLVVFWNYVKKERLKEKQKKANKVVLTSISGILGFVVISMMYWTILSSYKLSSGIPRGLDFFNGLAIMVGQTAGSVGFIMLISAAIFKIGNFVIKLFRKV